jgi:hypothetical protein
MWQVDGRKACVLTRGDLKVCETDVFRDHNPCSDVRLNYQKSAEAIVPQKDRGSGKG